ncbi:hypothetical protein C8T65DRAFT_82687 [Cerioporus squamosus]|nr:hypothetical protein C8T65DRAFT_82687 [Cerioporus squamosus]
MPLTCYVASGVSSGGGRLLTNGSLSGYARQLDQNTYAHSGYPTSCVCPAPARLCTVIFRGVSCCGFPDLPSVVHYQHHSIRIVEQPKRRTRSITLRTTHGYSVIRIRKSGTRIGERQRNSKALRRPPLPRRQKHYRLLPLPKPNPGSNSTGGQLHDIDPPYLRHMAEDLSSGVTDPFRGTFVVGTIVPWLPEPPRWLLRGEGVLGRF